MRGKKIYVGLSGGVDSAVTAALLQEQGADITGVFIKGWYPPGMPCTWADDRRDAMRVAAHLRIPFRTLDASEEYKKGVIDYLLTEYKAGRTPNPDIMCNREVKFGAFFNYAMQQGADFVATGHYAQTENGRLLKGIDTSKDQSYFLWAVPKEVFAKTLFPLGGMHKTRVRELAKKYNLPNALKKDSQGVCFLGSISVEEFLTQEFGVDSGAAVTADGELVGRHTGSLLHTLGERISLADALPGPWYVVAKDVEKNELVVSHTPTLPTETEHINLTSMNCIESMDAGSVSAQYRYHGPRVEGVISGTRFIPAEPITEPIAAGQSLVIYNGDHCLGGGIIV
ncbi:tRNA 2-thiouridine(34) synthase MnmA [Patescibacteria group bacterium]|nr:tRNA 2-thiouridine(34) synthase MnmA [Patescibacteria group bacterium]MBU1755157.1 tRNA 2-thiouridine(34) synthase MnmA [Patescibacteria group bacterium]